MAAKEVKMRDVEDAEIRCGDCKFFAQTRPVGKDIGGECRRFPPHPVALGGKMLTRFPMVFDHWGCGEWDPLPDE